MHKAKLAGNAPAVLAGVAELQRQQVGTGRALSTKFDEDGENWKGEMTYASLDAFFAGLEGLIGPPILLNGSLLCAMSAEHCNVEGESDAEWTTGNYSITSTPRIEWIFVNGPATLDSWPVEAELKLPDRKLRRIPEPLSIYEERMHAKNEELAAANHTRMVIEEVVAGRLYTGPMFEKYNAVLRFFSGKSRYTVEEKIPVLQQRCEDIHLGQWIPIDDGVRMWVWWNKYATTIHAINSCVLKLSKLTKAVEVWRGFVGATLPAAFFDPNAEDVCGGVEYGFSSTTTDREVAMHYAEGTASTMIRAKMGMIDRGADICWLSQYPHEREILFPPLLGLEVMNTTVAASTLIVTARLSLNMTALTLEQVTGKRRKLIEDTAQSLLAEAKGEVSGAEWVELNTWLSVDASNIALDLLRKMLNRITSHDPEYYNDNKTLRESLGDVISSKVVATSWPSGVRQLAALLGMACSPQWSCICITSNTCCLSDQFTHLILLGKNYQTNPSALLATKVLQAGHKQIFFEQTCGLVAILLLSTQLTKLDVQWNSLYEDGGCALSEALRCNNTLERLDMNTNWIGEKAGAWIGEALSVNCRLYELNLSYNKLGDQGGKAVGRALASNKTLAFLDISMNELGDVAAKAVMLGMLNNTTLRTLKLNVNSISDDSASVFCDFLKANQSLHELHLDGNRFENSKAALFRAADESRFSIALSGLEDNYDDDGAGFGPMLPIDPAIATGPAVRSPSSELDAVSEQSDGDVRAEIGDIPSIQESGA